MTATRARWNGTAIPDLAGGGRRVSGTPAAPRRRAPHPPQREACFGGIHKCLILRAYEGLPIGWISAVRPSRQPLRGFLRMRSFLNSINVSPHDEDDEERPTGSVSKHAPRPSSRYAGASSILSQALRCLACFETR